MDAPFKGSLLLEQIEGNLAQDSQILGAMVFTDSAVVFSEGDIERPMQAVFDAPVAAGGRKQCLGLPGQTADVVTGLDTGLCGYLTPGRHLHHGVKLGPLLPCLDVVQTVGVRDDPALTGLQAAVVLVHRAGVVMGDALEVECLGSLEEVTDIFVQPALVLLYRQQVVSLGFDDLLCNL